MEKRSGVEVVGVRCIAVAVADGVPLVVVAADLAHLLGGAAAVAARVIDRWAGAHELPTDSDGALRFSIGAESLCVSAERLPIGNRLTPSLLVVSPADSGAVPHLLEVVDLRPVRTP